MLRKIKFFVRAVRSSDASLSQPLLSYPTSFFKTWGLHNATKNQVFRPSCAQLGCKLKPNFTKLPNKFLQNFEGYLTLRKIKFSVRAVRSSDESLSPISPSYPKLGSYLTLRKIQAFRPSCAQLGRNLKIHSITVLKSPSTTW